MNSLRHIVRINRTAAAMLLVATFLSSQCEHLLAQSIYQPGFREFWGGIGYTTGSVEFNRRFKLWRPESSEKDGKIRRPKYSFRTSLLSDVPVDTFDDFGMPSWRDLESDEFYGGQPESGIDLLLGIRALESDHAFTLGIATSAYVEVLRTHRWLSSTQIGPQIGISATHNWKRLSADVRLASMLSYQRREYDGTNVGPWSVLEVFTGNNDSELFHRTSDDLSYGGELRLSGSYWLTDNARINITWSNMYLNTIYYPADQFRYNDSTNLTTQLPDNGRAGWVDLLQIALLVSR